MASFVESAVLQVKDQSTGPIRKINAELKKLFATAKSLKSIKVDIKVNTGNLAKATAEIRKLSAALRQLQSARTNIKVNPSGTSYPRDAASAAVAHANPQSDARSPGARALVRGEKTLW